MPADATPRLHARPVSADRLQHSRGGTDAGATSVVSIVDGAVTGNQAVNVSSGQNQISGGAFSGMSGLPVVIQNSGSNVLIQSSTVVNVHLR